MSTVPKGWRLVPEEPTEEMWDAFFHARDFSFQAQMREAKSQGQGWKGLPAVVWGAMLAAAPAVPDVPGEDSAVAHGQRINVREDGEFGDGADVRRAPEITDETAILRRLADGDAIVYSQDGDDCWFSKGDRAHIAEKAVISLRDKGYIERRVDEDDDTDNYRGMAEYDAISAAGREALSKAKEADGDQPS